MALDKKRENRMIRLKAGTCKTCGYQGPPITLSDEERQTISAAAQTARSRRSLCYTLYGSLENGNYERVSMVCDELGLLKG